MNQPTAPIMTFRVPPVEAAIFLRTAEGERTMPQADVQISRNYRDQAGWHKTSRFSEQELPKVVLVAQEAYRYLALRQSAAHAESPGHSGSDSGRRGGVAGGAAGPTGGVDSGAQTGSRGDTSGTRGGGDSGIG